MSRADEVARAYEVQGKLCVHLEAPFYGALFACAARDAAARGPAFEVAASFEGDALRGLLPLRVFAAAHRRALAGDAEELARHFAAAADGQAAWPAMRDVLGRDASAIAGELGSFPQTNEVARAAALLPGLLAVARASDEPLHLLELGASAGLNLLADRFRIEIGGRVFGDAASPVRIEVGWEGPSEPLAGAVRVASRAGCDLEPRDPADPATALWMTSFVWPDDALRIERLRAALALAARAPAPVERARAGDWVASRLADPLAGPTVVYHSSFWGYVPEDEQRAIRAAIDAAAARAERGRPLAWLRLEVAPGGAPDLLELTTWPGGETRRLLQTGPHPRRLRWFGEVIP